jgi:hypothetical protein
LIGSSHQNLDSVEEQAVSYFLGPVGVFDPSEFIAAESQRIPFKISLTKPHEWQDTLKNWPLPPIVGWRIGTRGYLMTKAPKQKIGTNFVFLIA